MDKTELQNISFQIIGYAGNAFSNFYRSVEEVRRGNYEKAELLMKEGQEEMHLAHKAQTDLLSCEVNGEDLDFSIILIHAQDHLMTTIMYERIAKQLISIVKEGGCLKNEE